MANRKRRRAEALTAALNNQLEEQVVARSAELSARTAELQTIFDCASSGIALIANRTFVRGNRRLHEMFGWPDTEMIGKSVEIWYVDKNAYLEAAKLLMTEYGLAKSIAVKKNWCGVTAAFSGRA